MENRAKNRMSFERNMKAGHLKKHFKVRMNTIEQGNELDRDGITGWVVENM